MSTVLVLNGPNLNLLGSREPEVYGSQTLADIEADCRALADQLGVGLEFRQSNHEGELVDWLQDAGRRQQLGELLGVVLNPAAYSHTSLAIHDAIVGSDVTVIEVHISNVHRREEFRQHSYVSAVAAGVIVGLGRVGYDL